MELYTHDGSEFRKGHLPEGGSRSTARSLEGAPEARAMVSMAWGGS